MDLIIRIVTEDGHYLLAKRMSYMLGRRIHMKDAMCIEGKLSDVNLTLQTASYRAIVNS